MRYKNLQVDSTALDDTLPSNLVFGLFRIAFGLVRTVQSQLKDFIRGVVVRQTGY